MAVQRGLQGQVNQAFEMELKEKHMLVRPTCAPHYYRIVGRCKDIINRGGVKLSPSELDSLLEGVAGLAEAAVCAYADADLGEKVCACTVPLEGAGAPTLAGLRQHLADRGVARFKLPERLEIFDALPRNPLGKVQRNVLRELVEARKPEE